MRNSPLRAWWPALLAAAVGLTALFGGSLQTRFLNDDYLLLEEARTRTLAESLGDLGPLGNYYRPLSRQVYFVVLTSLAGDHALAFHLANYALFLLALGLVAELLLVFLPAAGAMAGVLYFALLPLQSVNLTWVSCSQDLLALAGALGAFALYRRARSVAALVAFAAAIASKESALPLPIAFIAWDILIRGERARRALLRALPFLLFALAWSVFAWWMRAAHGSAAPLEFDLEHLAANAVHLVQSLLGLEDPAGFVPSLMRSAPALGPLLLLVLACWLRPPDTASAPTRARPARQTALLFGIAWLLTLGIAPAPVAYDWSSYHFTLAAVGGALLVGLALAHLDRWALSALVVSLLWWHAGSTQVRAFGVSERPWVMTSHVTRFYFARAAALTDSMSRQLLDLEPDPPRDTRFFFATLPSWAGFQMGNGALIRHVYRNPSIESFFYSRFSDSTAANHPVRFVYWDGARLQPLYWGATDRFFQVGSDLLLLDRPAGAAHAYVRGLAAGESPRDHLYWLGWAELMRGDRARAEAAWSRFGARDDSLLWATYLRAAVTRLDDGDTLGAKRDLANAIQFGIGRPEAHAVLGALLMGERPKYATMELKVATYLKPGDWLARRDLLEALEFAHLDAGAREELGALKRIYPEWSSDSVVVRVERRLAARSTAGRPVARF